MTSVPPEEIARAGSTLARSHTVRTGLLWVLTAVVLPAAGWGAAKLDTQKDIVALREAITALTNQQRETVKRLDDAVPDINARINGVQRDIVIGTVAALAFETDKIAKAKLAAGDRAATDSYDAQVRSLVPPATAAQSTIRTGAIPHVAH